MLENVTNMFSNLLGKTKKDMFRISVTGKIAVKAGNGYRTFDPEKNKLVSVGDFALPGFQDMFFLVPTRKLKKGDIIVIEDEALCVLEQNDNEIKVLSYATSKVETRLVDNILWFGRPFYGKLTSLLGMAIGNSGSDKGCMKMMLLSQFMGAGRPQDDQQPVQPAAPAFGGGGITMESLLMMSMLMGGKGGGLFDGLFDFDEEGDGDDGEK